MILYKKLDATYTYPHKDGIYDTNLGLLSFTKDSERWESIVSGYRKFPSYFYFGVEIPDNIVSTFAFLQEE